MPHTAAMIWKREESMIGHHKRHPFTVRCRWGARRDGTITAVEAELIADGGAYASTSAEVTKVATLFAWIVPWAGVRSGIRRLVAT